MTWKCHIYETNNDRYEMILGIYLLTALGMDLKFSKNFVIGGYGPYEGCSAPMVDASNYNFNYLLDKAVKPEESFINSYLDKCLKSKIPISSTRRMHIILDAKHKKADPNKVIDEQCQHLNITKYRK